MEAVTDSLFLGSKITVDGDCSHEIKRCLLPGRKAMTNLDCIKKQRHHFADKGPYSQSYGLSSSHVQLWELDHKEGWTLKNWFFWIVVLEKILLRVPLTCKFKPGYPKGNQPWILIGRTDSEAEAPILWPPDAGKDWRQKEKRAAEDEMIGWHHQFNGHELGRSPGDSEEQGGLACCSPGDHKESDMT